MTGFRSTLLSGLLFISLFGVIAFTVPAVPTAEAQGLSEEEKTRLRAEYDRLQEEIAQWQKVLDDTRAKKNTIQGDVSALNAQIKQAETQIKQKNLTITRLASEINEKNRYIGQLEDRLDSNLAALAKIIRYKDEADTKPLAILALASEDLSTFFAEIEALDAINQGLQTVFEDIRDVKSTTESERQALAERQEQEVDAKYEAEAKKQVVAKKEAEKKQLLALTAKEEKSYQTILAERQQRAEQIRTALFDLRDTQGISFAKALEYAEFAAEKTGVRAAMILAILSQESDLGKNIGSCYVTNLSNGDGVGKNTGRVFEQVMKAPRDTEPFERITKTLGLPFATTPVSCPLGQTYSPNRGYGGAMGPSQFIPSTWVLYEKRLRSALGTSQPNPWDPKHAITATALYLQDLDADAQTYTKERNAACRYYSGRACDNKKPTNYTYGDSVVAKAKQFQENIDFLRSI